MFSRMNRVKMDFHNQLSRERLENCLRISEEGCDIAITTQTTQLKNGTKGKSIEYHINHINIQTNGSEQKVQPLMI